MGLTYNFCGTRDRLSAILADSLKRSRPPKRERVSYNEGSRKDGVGVDQEGQAHVD